MKTYEVWDKDDNFLATVNAENEDQAIVIAKKDGHTTAFKVTEIDHNGSHW